MERLRREASRARNALGYAPSLLLSVDGRGLAQVDREEEDRLITSVDAAVAADIADDMVAVVREGLSNVARHAHASSVTVDVKIEGVQPGSELCCGTGDDEGHASGDAEPFRGRPVVEIVCRDDGVGVKPGAIMSGLGTRIVQTLVRGELRGSIDWEPLSGGGTDVVIHARLNQRASRSET